MTEIVRRGDPTLESVHSAVKKEQRKIEYNDALYHLRREFVEFEHNYDNRSGSSEKVPGRWDHGLGMQKTGLHRTHEAIVGQGDKELHLRIAALWGYIDGKTSTNILEMAIEARPSPNDSFHRIFIMPEEGSVESQIKGSNYTLEGLQQAKDILDSMGSSMRRQNIAKNPGY